MILANPPPKFETVEEVPSLGQVVKKFNGLIDSSFLSSQDKNSPPNRSEPIDIPKRDGPSPCPPPSYDSWREDPLPTYMDVANPEFVTAQIAEQIEAGLKRAKTSTLDCVEVLIPLNLTQQIALDVLSSSDSEPCGLRGCILYINFEDDSKEVRRIGCVRPVGSNPVPTFELYLTLKQANSGWLTAVSNRIWKSLGRKSIVISESYQLSKKRLFRS